MAKLSTTIVLIKFDAITTVHTPRLPNFILYSEALHPEAAFTPNQVQPRQPAGLCGDCAAAEGGLV